MENDEQRPLILDMFYDGLMCEDVNKNSTILGFIVLMSFVSFTLHSCVTRRISAVYRSFLVNDVPKR